MVAWQAPSRWSSGTLTRNPSKMSGRGKQFRYNALPVLGSWGTKTPTLGGRDEQVPSLTARVAARPNSEEARAGETVDGMGQAEVRGELLTGCRRGRGKELAWRALEMEARGCNGGTSTAIYPALPIFPLF